MSDVIEVDIQEHFPVEIIEVHVDENAAQDAIDAAALAQQTLEFCQDIVANLGVVNTIFVNNGFTKVGSEFTGLAGTQWNINGTNYSKAANQTITIPLCAAGMVRTDRIVLDTNNNFLLVQGVEVTVNPVAESKPVNTLDYTFIPVNDTEVGEPDTPTIGNIFNKKDYDKVYTFNASGTDVEIPFNVSGFSTIELTGSVTSVKGFSFTDLSANPTLAEWPHKGKPFILINRSGHDIELKHNNLTTIVPFNFDSGSGIVIPNNGKFLLKLMTNAVIDIFKSWVDNIQVYKTIASNTTIDNTYHNSIVWVTGTSNITIPSGLRSDFTCTFRTLTGAVATFVASGTTINSESDGDVMADKSMCLLATYSSNNFVLSGGGLS